jgi:hypothetical protein
MHVPFHTQDDMGAGAQNIKEDSSFARPPFALVGVGSFMNMQKELQQTWMRTRCIIVMDG